MKKLAIGLAILLGAIAVALAFVHLGSERSDPAADPAVIEVSKEELRRDFGDPNDVKNKIMLSPRFIDGRMDGIELLEVAAGSAIERLGGRKGDIVLSVGGVPLDGPESAMAASDRAKTLDEIEVKLLRDGQPHRFVVRLRD